MQIDFHYYATYCAAYLSGYSHDESLAIAYSAQLVDCCSEKYVSKIKAPRAAVTTQTQLELADAGADILSLQNITRIWASFHFLPGDLYAVVPGRPRRYRNKYRMICDVNGDLLVETVMLAKGKSLQAAGIANACSGRHLGTQVFCRHAFACDQQHRLLFLRAGSEGRRGDKTADYVYEQSAESR